ncbi:MAG: competence/damage-inducible protein A [Verrucomicrobia bacterium]|nr:MAG: competence/damage-inducible protein A [Verrucomicrobiota bacterium]PYL76948.1 MAG: competence/damage-inducible protein A [Verrucomicrobiota bacterium]PYM10782.1 MAG: competence/damage-inducible protein A [Verrucomicrobiota bacterium]
MRVIVINTGTEILLGDVLNTHLAFIAREIFQFGLRINEQRTIPDGDTIQSALADVSLRAEIVFVTGGLGPTSDDITREIVAGYLQLPLVEDAIVREGIRSRLAARRIPTTKRIWRQALVPAGADVLPNENGTAPGLYLPANINPGVPLPHLFLLPGPPRELQPMFRNFVAPVLRRITAESKKDAMRTFRVANMGESIIEKKIGDLVLAVPGIELGYCARPGEVEVRVIGSAAAVAQAEKIIREKLGNAIFSASDETLAAVLVRLLSEREQTLALAESCTGGFLADQITNVPGASKVFVAGYVTYSNQEKIRSLGVSRKSIEKFGAVSERVVTEMAEGSRARTGATHGVATTGIAGPGGGSEEKPVGTVFVGLSSENQPARWEKFFFPSDRETFKQLVAQRAFDLLRRKLME